MQGWFYKFGSQIHGSVSLDELQELYARGTIGPDTLLRRSGQWQWVAVHSLAELALQSSPPRPQAPAALPVRRAPVTPAAHVVTPAPHVVSPAPRLSIRRSSPVAMIVLASGGAAMVALLVVVAAMLSNRPIAGNQGGTALPAGTVPASSSSAKLTSDQIFARLSPGVVKVHVSQRDGEGNGSGFFIHRDGLIATNYHVIEEAVSLTIEDHVGRVYEVTDVVAIDPAGDLALLEVDVRPEAVLPLADSRLPVIGSQVYAIGSPLGLKNTISPGLISGHRELDQLDFSLLQTSTPISPGSSGGPLISEQGTVIGITTLVLSGKNAQNLNFAVPVSRLRRLMVRNGY